MTPGAVTRSSTGGAHGPPKWETFHIGQVIPWVDANLPTTSAREGRATHELNYAAHDPAALADINLRDTKILLFSGNGQPGPLDDGIPNAGAMRIEGAVWRPRRSSTTASPRPASPLLRRLRARDAQLADWARALRETMGPLIDGFAHPPARPARVSYTSADDAYDVYAWQVTMHRTAREWSTPGGATRTASAWRAAGAVPWSRRRRSRRAPATPCACAARHP